MARYIKEFPMVDFKANSYAKIHSYLTSQKFVQKIRDGENLFQKGDGIWAAPSFIKIVYCGNTARVEAWIDVYGEDQGLDGFTGIAVKKPLKKVVEQVEQILQTPGADYGPDSEPMEEDLPENPTPVVPVSKKEFFRKHAGESFYRNLRINAIIGYVVCGITLMTAVLNPFLVIDALLLLGLVLGMHLGTSKVCAILITVYGVFNVVSGLLSAGIPSGWAVLIVGIYSWIVFRNAEKRYRKMIGKA